MVAVWSYYGKAPAMVMVTLVTAAITVMVTGTVKAIGAFMVGVRVS